MSWICKTGIETEQSETLFTVGKEYSEQDDRGEADDIAICLLSDKGVKIYLIDQWVREHFDEKLETKKEITMKHEKVITSLLRDFLYKDWMSETEYEKLVDSTLSMSGLTKEKLSEDLETGVKNGHSIECQIKIIKSVLVL